MTLETELVTHLTDDAGVSALISTRVYPGRLPQDFTLPALIYQKISGPRIYHLAGVSGRARVRIQIDSWADTFAGSKTLSEAVRSSLSGFNGVLTTIKAVIKLENERDDFDDDSELFRVIQDYLINHSEA